MKRTLLPPELLRADTQAFLNVLNDERDFEIVVVSAGYLDACLGTLLHRALRKSAVTERLLDPRHGALGSFATRADLAYAMTLIPKPLYQDLGHFANIRNMVAHHHISLSFDDPAVRDACVKLTYLSTVKNGDLDELLFGDHRPLPPPRERFKFTALFILDFLLRAAESHTKPPTEA